METFNWKRGEPCPICGPHCPNCRGFIDIVERGEGREGTFYCGCCSTVIIPTDSEAAREMREMELAYRTGRLKGPPALIEDDYAEHMRDASDLARKAEREGA